MSLLKGRPNGHILCVGHLCVDIISLCSTYPEEDQKVGTTTRRNRCIDQRWQRGGNAANNCTVLGLLGSKPYFCGTIAASHERSFIMDDFAKYDVNTEYAVVHEGCECPASCVILSEATGSRTIIHCNKDLPELAVDEFKKVNLSNFSWIHFEGRNVSNIREIIELVREYNSSHSESQPIIISVEIEKAKPEVEVLVPLADVIFVARDYAAYKGYTSMDDAIANIQLLAMPEATVICPWGEMGASACTGKKAIVRSPVFSPPKVIDTLGAGDTFIAATIYSLFEGKSLQESIRFGCKIAGAKVGVRGWEPLRDIITNIMHNFHAHS
ncbi:hypothetical protein SK128_000024 [Halocaridina rubra]|uniref:Carbohydrate kinase PfkB domain-containing protein n=1 Tax=Halocaridina rubra TaxID=373956 RepID=A0AAN8XIB6_HALRR